MDKENTNININQEVLAFQIQRVFANLGRNILSLLEDIKGTHQNNFEKLYDNLPQEFHGIVDMANYLDENRSAWARKRILDNVMSAKRDLESLIENT